MSEWADPVKAAEGMTFVHAKSVDGWELPRGQQRTYTVKPKCDGARYGGQWVCLTHGTTFDNQVGKDVHVHERKKPCTLAWYCRDHGDVEVP
jgi:hypothetical protein